MSSPSSACDCDGAQQPAAVTNPPGLSTISDRVNDFCGFRRALLEPLANEQALGDAQASEEEQSPGSTQALAPWAPVAGDLGLQVLEWWAYLADVLTFYNEQIANESYLRTAKSAAQLADLVALIGYLPAPGIAAVGQLAALRSQAHPNEPLSLPAAMPVSSTATAEVPSQVFEVQGEVDGQPWTFQGPSQLPVTLLPNDSLARNESGGPESVLLSGHVSGVKAGEELLLLAKDWAGSDDNWSWVTVASVAPALDPATGTRNTLVTFTATAGFGPGVVENDTGCTTVWEPGETVNGLSSSPAATSYRLLRPSQTASLWTQGAQSPIAKPWSLAVHLSAVVRAIAPGDLVLFDGSASGVVNGLPPSRVRTLALVKGVSEDLWTVPYPGPAATPPEKEHPAIVIAHTALEIETHDTGVLERYYGVQSALDSIAVRYGFRAVGTIIGTPRASLSELPETVGIPSGWSVPGGGTGAILQDASGAGFLVEAISTAEGEAGEERVLLKPAGATPSPLPKPLHVPLRLLLDLVPVSRGATVASEVLGGGNAALANQSFTLRRSPLTYLSTGSTLVVYVDESAWSEVPSFYGQSADARVYTVRLTSDGTATVTFGDGVNGARLKSGSGNVKATYRYGSGAASPPAGRLTSIVKPQPNLSSLVNPIAVFGGADPQPVEDIRENAPASVFTFGRAISALDYEVIAAHAPGISRASAVWGFDETTQRTTVTIYVGGDSGALAAAQAALASAQDPNRLVSVLPATAVEVELSCTLIVAEDQWLEGVKAAATAAIADRASGLFSPAALGIGERLYRSQVDEALMVAGVLAVHGLVVSVVGSAGERGEGEQLEDVLDPGSESYLQLAGEGVSITALKATAGEVRETGKTAGTAVSNG